MCALGWAGLGWGAWGRNSNSASNSDGSGSSSGRAQALELAAHAYDFLAGSALWDAGERQCAWAVSRGGSKVVLTPEKVL